MSWSQTSTTALVLFSTIFAIAFSNDQYHLIYSQQSEYKFCRLCDFEIFNADMESKCKDRNGHMQPEEPVGRDGVMKVAWCRNGYIPSCPVPTRQNTGRINYLWNKQTFGGNGSFNVYTNLTILSCRTGFELVGPASVQCTHSTKKGATSATKLGSDLGHCVRKTTPTTTTMMTTTKIRTTPKREATKIAHIRENATAAPESTDNSDGGLSPIIKVVAAFSVIVLICVIGVVVFCLTRDRNVLGRPWTLMPDPVKAKMDDVQIELESGVASLSSSATLLKSSADSEQLTPQGGAHIGNDDLPPESHSLFTNQLASICKSTNPHSLKSKDCAVLDS